MEKAKLWWRLSKLEVEMDDLEAKVPDLPVKKAADCPPCNHCGEPWCVECGAHLSECAHPLHHADVNELVDEMKAEAALEHCGPAGKPN